MGVWSSALLLTVALGGAGYLEGKAEPGMER